MVAPFARALNAAGGDVVAAYKLAGFPNHGPEQPLIPAQDWYDFISACSKVLRDPHFAFKVGFETPFPSLPNLCILKTQGVSLGECLSALVVDAKHLTNMASYSLVIGADAATLSQHRKFRPDSRPSQPDGFFVGFILRLVRQATGVHWHTAEFHARVSSPRAIPKTHLPKGSVSRTTRDVQFRFPADWLPLGRDAGQTRISEIGEAVSTDFVALVSEVVALRSGDPDLKVEDVAHRLSLTTRDLQEKLSEKGRTFRKILVGARIAHARRLLKETDMSVAEIGSRVGYLESCLNAPSQSSPGGLAVMVSQRFTMTSDGVVEAPGVIWGRNGSISLAN